MGKNKNSRRSFLSQIGISAGATLLSPSALLYDSLLQGIMMKAAAKEMGVSPRRLVDIQVAGAPSRWAFDLFLDPLKTGKNTPNPHMGTRYVASGGRYVNVKYETITRKLNGRNLQLPYMWQFDVPRAGGGRRPMLELLNNLLSISGVDTGNSGHGGSIALQFRPLGSSQSTSAMVGDYNNTPFSNVSMNADNFIYRSLAGKTSVSLSGEEKLLNTLLAPFMKKNIGNFNSSRKLIEAEIRRSITALNSSVENQQLSAESLSQNIFSAENLIHRGFDGFEEFWQQTYAKYQSLIDRVFDPKEILPGINDLPIGTLGARNDRYNVRDTAILNSDLRSLIGSGTNIKRMAAHFTIAEYVLMKDLSHSVNFSIPPVSGLLTRGPAKNYVHDEHKEGSMPILLLNTLSYRATAACLLEFIDRLKEKRIFSETVIRYGSEFNRSPRVDGSGSDHGFHAASTAIYSGAINGPIFLGNQQDTKDSKYRGSWGEGAPIDGVGKLNVGHIAATLATVLRVPNPVTAAPSLVDDRLTPVYGETKKV